MSSSTRSRLQQQHRLCPGVQAAPNRAMPPLPGASGCSEKKAGTPVSRGSSSSLQGWVGQGQGQEDAAWQVEERGQWRMEQEAARDVPTQMPPTAQCPPPACLQLSPAPAAAAAAAVEAAAALPLALLGRERAEPPFLRPPLLGRLGAAGAVSLGAGSASSTPAVGWVGGWGQQSVVGVSHGPQVGSSPTPPPNWPRPGRSHPGPAQRAAQPPS